MFWNGDKKWRTQRSELAWLNSFPTSVEYMRQGSVWVIIGSGNGLSSVQHQAITYLNAEIQIKI